MSTGLKYYTYERNHDQRNSPRPPEKIINDSEKVKSKSLHRVPPIPSIQRKKKNNNTTDEKTSESKHPKTDILTTKTPQNEDFDAETTQADRTLQLTTQAVIINKRTTTPVTLEIRPTHGSSNLNIAIAHRNILLL